MAQSREKHFVVLGLGSFGGALARKLTKNGCRVTGVDADRDCVEDFKDDLYEAVVADATDREVLAQLSLTEVDGVFIALDEDISHSLLATLHTKELGARHVTVKGVSVDHSKILKQMRVDRVVFPDREIAEELADRATWPNVLDYLPIDPEFSIVELAVPESSVGQTLREADYRRRFGIWILGIKDALSGKVSLFPDPETKLNDDQVLYVVGTHEGIGRMRELR